MTTSNPTPASPMLSIVVPVYNETAVLPLFQERITQVLEGVTRDWEIIMVNDGSTDGTLDMAKRWQQSDSRIKILSLSRNFGKEAALTAGIVHAYGQAVIPIDADMQEPPELIVDMIAKWREGYKVVIAVRRNRDSDTWIKRSTANLYYHLLSRLSDTSIPRNTGDFRLMDKQVVDVLRLLPERGRFMKGLFAWVGFKTTEVYFDRQPRAAGQPAQTVGKLYRLARDGIIAFSTFPLQIATYVGLFISLLAIGYGSWLLIRTIVFGADVPGYASIMASVLFMGGVQMVFIGIIGEYLGRIYNESKQRPIFIVEEKIGIEEK